VTAPEDYVSAVVAGLHRLGVPVLDSWVQEDDDRWEGLVEVQDDDTTGALGFAWNEEKGWERLWRHGSREVGSFSKYSNTEDAAPVDAPVDEVVRLITDEAGLDPDQTTLF
jgi:hypothetical protein